MKKFKPGDRVRYNNPTENGWHGVTGVIAPAHRDQDPAFVYFYPDEGQRHPHSGTLISDANRSGAGAGMDDYFELIKDSVHQPAHYTAGDIECIDAIKAQMTPEAFKGYLRGNLVKYAWRYEHKGGVESLEKAKWYLERLIAEVRADA